MYLDPPSLIPLPHLQIRLLHIRRGHSRSRNYDTLGGGTLCLLGKIISLEKKRILLLDDFWGIYRLIPVFVGTLGISYPNLRYEPKDDRSFILSE